MSPARETALLLLLATSAAPRSAAAGSWTDRIDVSGDVRYRVELIDQADRDLRHRHRIRARAGLAARLSDGFDAVLQLGTGEADDPVSDNQTLTGGASSKPVWLSQAYLGWAPAEWLALRAGKMPNPFLRVGDSELLWDPDISPEGLALVVTPTFGAWTPFLRASFQWAEERKEGADAWLLGGQAGAVVELGCDLELTLGGGYLDHSGLRGQPFLWESRGAGNRLATDSGGIEEYAADFDLLEAFGELAGASPWGQPWSVFGSYVRNLAASGDDEGWVAGARIGKAVHPWDTSFRYQYKRLEADAVVGAWTDSDFIGGGTDGSGHELNVSVKAAERVSLDLTGFANRTPLQDAEDYLRLQLDVKAKF